MERIQEILNSESYLRPRQMIEYMAGQFTDHRLVWDDFYRIIVGINGKKKNPLSHEEFQQHEKKLLDDLIMIGLYDNSESFLKIDYDLPLGRHMRFYMNAKDAESSRHIIRSVVKEFKNQRFKIKTVGMNIHGFSRFDNTILYVSRNEAGNYVEFLKQLSHSWFDDEVPLTTRKLAKGIGYAASPRKMKLAILGRIVNSVNHSLNSMHGTVLKLTFDKVIQKGIEEYDDITQLYRQALRGAGFNPDRIYLNSDTEDILE